MEKTKTTQVPVVSKGNANACQLVQMPIVTNLIAEVTRPRPGQPTLRNTHLIEEVIDRIACGQSLVAVCQDPTMPGYSTIMRWCQQDRELLAAIDEAYEWHARTLDDIADDMLAGGPTSTGDFRRDEARVAHMRWRLGKINRRRYGDKVQMDVVTHQPVIIDWNTIEGEGGDGV